MFFKADIVPIDVTFVIGRAFMEKDGLFICHLFVHLSARKLYNISTRKNNKQAGNQPWKLLEDVLAARERCKAYLVPSLSFRSTLSPKEIVLRIEVDMEFTSGRNLLHARILHTPDV